MIIEMRNPNAEWQDKDTFRLVFDGGVDEDGDSFFYCCEYWKDAGEWHFEAIYEDDHIKADLAPEQIEEIKKYMENAMMEESTHAD